MDILIDNTVICDFTDFSIVIENTAIKVVGKIEVEFLGYKLLFNSAKYNFKAIVYSDIIPIIINNYRNTKKAKDLIIDFLNTSKNNQYKILSFNIDDVFDINKRERKKKIEKINKYDEN